MIYGGSDVECIVCKRAREHNVLSAYTKATLKRNVWVAGFSGYVCVCVVMALITTLVLCARSQGLVMSVSVRRVFTKLKERCGSMRIV